jgi:hypothetical protein
LAQPVGSQGKVDFKKVNFKKVGLKLPPAIHSLMRLVGLLLSLALIGFLLQRLYGGPTKFGPSGSPAITEPIQRTEEAVERANRLEQDRLNKTMGELQPGTKP